MYWESPTQPPCRELHIAWGWRSEDLLEQAWLKVRLIGEVVFWGADTDRTTALTGKQGS